MLKTNRVLMAVAATILALGLTGCGKEKYEGTYTGYEIRTYETGAAGQNQQQPYNQGYGNTGYNNARAVSLTLSNSGEVVSGTYSVTATNSGSYYNTSAQGETYQFNGSSSQSGQVSNIMLISTGGYSQFSNCLMQGTLTSQNKGQSLSGTLTSIGSNGASNCGSLQISLTRSN